MGLLPALRALQALDYGAHRDGLEAYAEALYMAQAFGLAQQAGRRRGEGLFGAGIQSGNYPSMFRDPGHTLHGVRSVYTFCIVPKMYSTRDRKY